MSVVDHLVYAVPNLEEAGEWLLRSTGVRPAQGGRHVGLGSHNAVAGLSGHAYLELIAPDPDQDIDLGAHPFGLSDLKEPRLVSWAVAVTAIEERVHVARREGYDPGEIESLQRERPDGVVLRWRLTRRAELPFGGVVPFLIDWGDSEHPSAGAPNGLRLRSLFATHPDPDGVERALGALGVELGVTEGRDPGSAPFSNHRMA